MERRQVANPLALAILAWLLVEPMHPYELGRRLEESELNRSVKYNRGSLYMVVKQLDRAGYIATLETVRDGQRPERTIYEITEAGRAELYDWLGELMAMPREEYPHFGVALSLLSVLDPDRAVELLQHRLEVLAAQAAEGRTLLGKADDSGVRWVFLVEEQYRLALQETEHRFVKGLIESLKQPDYVQAWREAFGDRT